jgi:hypothetical protein
VGRSFPFFVAPTERNLRGVRSVHSFYGALLDMPQMGEEGLPCDFRIARGSRRQGRPRGASRRAPRVGCAEP